MKRIAITGSSGHFGRGFIQFLRELTPESQILGIDVVPPVSAAPDEFHELEVRDPRLVQVLSDFQPDTVIHMAFVVNMIHNDQLMRAINVNGSRNVLRAVSTVKPQRFLYCSSMTAYGAWPDNPVPITEEWQLRSRSEFRYAADKTELEQDVQHFAKANPEIAVAWVRPAIVLGEGIRNYLTRYVLQGNFVALADGVDSPIQFVHADDLSRALWEILRRDARGPFNVCPDDWMTWTEIARLRKRFVVKLPLQLIEAVTKVWWSLRLPAIIAELGFPPGLMKFIRYPWVGRPMRLTEELGFQFRFSSLETLKLALAAVQSAGSSQSSATNHAKFGDVAIQASRAVNR